MTILDKIKKRRQLLAITQQELADRSDIGLRTIKQIESGQGNPSLDTLNRILEALDMELDTKLRSPECRKLSTSNYYTVAQHTFLIRAPQGLNINTLIPSLQPFETTDNSTESPLFTLFFLPDIPEHKGITLLTHFEWDEAECTIYTTKNGYEIQIQPRGESAFRRMVINKDLTRAFVEVGADMPTDRFVAGNFLMMLYAFATAPHDTLMFHASVIHFKNKGYLFLGKSGTGKSTHSRLWLENIAGSRLLNDDNPIVRLHPNGEAWVYGSPWSGKTPCYRNEAVQVGAIVRIKQAPYNCIEREKTVRAFASLLPSCSCLRQEKHLFDAVCDTVSRLATTAPVYELECQPNAEAAQLCNRTIAKE